LLKGTASAVPQMVKMTPALAAEVRWVKLTGYSYLSLLLLRWSGQSKNEMIF
jgi:hypothetical protein